MENKSVKSRQIIYGRNAARECLRARRRHIHQVFIADNVQSSAIIDEIIEAAQRLKVPVGRVSRKILNRQAKSHQGVILEVGRYPTVSTNELLNRTEKLAEPPFIVALDHIEDPHNLGAILRTAEAVGVHGVIIPKQRSVGITSTVVNASAGAAEHIQIAEAPNLVQTLNEFKKHGIWVVGLENISTASSYVEANLTGALVLVIGSEGKGMSRLVKETCDFLVRLPMRGQVSSLNASVAAALMLYEIWRTRGFE